MLVQEALSVMFVPTTGVGFGVVTAQDSAVGGLTPACQVTVTEGAVPE
jgi:hypothetical protein